MSDLSVVHENANIGQDVKIGPFCYVEEDVHIGKGTILEPNVTIYSGSRIGENCHIFPGAVIGGRPQDKSFGGELTTVEVGDRVVIREHCTLHRGTTQNWKTIIGDDCYFMAYVHIGHDCIISNNVTIANASNLGGHVHVGAFANIGGMVPIHQFSRIGQQSMIGGGVTIRTDVPPYIKVARDPASFVGVNTIGLKRKGFSQEQIEQISDIFRIIFVKHRNKKIAVEYIREHIADSSFKNEIIEFVLDAKRGLVKGIH